MLHLWSSVFAPVGRGTAGHPDGDRQRDEHAADRRADRQTRLHGQPRNQTQHVVPRPTRASPTGRTGRNDSGPARGPAGTISPAGPAQGRPSTSQGAQAVPSGLGTPMVLDGRTAAARMVPAADLRPSASGASRRRVDALLSGDPVPVGLRRQGETGAVGPLPAAGPPAAAQGERQGRGPYPHTGQDAHPREALRAVRPFPVRRVGGRRRHRCGMQPAYRGRETHAFPHGAHRA